MNTDGMIDVTGVPLERLVQGAYRLSRPMGLGALHFKQGDLDADSVAAIIAADAKNERIAVHMDYVKGRCCKFTVFRSDGRLWIRGTWQDHSTEDITDLIDYAKRQ